MASKEAMSSYRKIQPHWVSKATDICSADNKVYIIRSDLKHYMVTSDLHRGTDIAVHALHPACQGGDHYLANYNGFYIIKGDSGRFVKDLTTDEDGEEFSLHPNCRGGTHYASYSVDITGLVLKKRFVIIWAGQGKAREVCNLTTDLRGRNFSLANDCKGGLYYWGTTGNPFLSGYNFLSFGKWGLTYHFTTKLWNNMFQKKLSVSPDVIPLLPGGLAVTLQGPSYGRWELIQSFKNESDTTVHWEQTIKHQVGYKKSELESIERHWDVQISATCGLTASIAKLHFSTEASYGRIKRQTSQEEWTDSTEESKAMSYDIEPGKTIHIWQYQLGFGNKPVLFARNIVATSSADPPTADPFKTDKK